MKKSLWWVVIILWAVICFMFRVFLLEDNQEKEGGKAKINDDLLTLVNKNHKLSVQDEVQLVPFQNCYVDKRMYNDLCEMFRSMKEEGLNPLVCSGYRTYDKQKTLYDRKVKDYLSQGFSLSKAKQEAALWVALPDYSEHQTGLAVDIVSFYYQLLDKQQETTPEQQWLMQHCYEYGFILRYPYGKSHLTFVHYEPWHYRYVGKKHAQEIMKKQLCLEEYLDKI